MQKMNDGFKSKLREEAAAYAKAFLDRNPKEVAAARQELNALRVDAKRRDYDATAVEQMIQKVFVDIRTQHSKEHGGHGR